MKLLLIAFSMSVMSVTMLGAAESQPKAAKKKPTAAVAETVEIPKGAVASDDGSFRYTDAQGKQWIYRKTPFGVARIADEPGAKSEAKVPEAFEYMDAFDAGDSVRFERPGPF